MSQSHFVIATLASNGVHAYVPEKFLRVDYYHRIVAFSIDCRFHNINIGGWQICFYPLGKIGLTGNDVLIALL